MVSDSTDETNDRDHEEEDSTGCDASNNRKTCHYPGNFPCTLNVRISSDLIMFVSP